MQLDEQPAYLSDPAFQAKHRGPVLRGKGGYITKIRDPSPTQILERAAAIRAARPRPMVGGTLRWSPPLFHRETLEAVEG